MEYELGRFEAKVREALERVRLVLDAEKNPTLPSELHHQYEDKYLLAEYLTNTAAASQLNCLSILGISAEQVVQLQEWAKTSAVSLRLRSEERCTYLREETREVEDPTKNVTDVSVGGVISKTFTSKVVTKVTEYFWKYEVSYELLAVRGVGEQPSDRLQILARTGSDELKTSAKSSPKAEKTIPAANFEVQISWLLRQLPAGAMSPAFKVDRAAQACKTPRRNPQVEEAGKHFNKFLGWAHACINYLDQMLKVQPDPTRKLDLNVVKPRSVVISVVPLMIRSDGSEGNAPQEAAGSAAAAVRTLACLSSSGGQLLSPEDANRLLGEEARTLEEQRSQVKEALPSSTAVATAAEGCMIVVLRQCEEVCKQWSAALDYVEMLLRKQLIAAIGKEVQPSDFAEYMRFHNRKLFAEGYLPVPFCFAVRRSAEHAPEGTLSLEQNTGGEIATPIVTMVAQSDGLHQMQFPLSASTNVRFGGERYLHAWLNHKFSGDAGAPLSLVARARQFSSMLVLVGRIGSATVFEPKYAAIIQNKDELTIPLELSTIPTPKEFKDAVESLSPEMRSFAKAFRAMQLESTLFGVLVIHIKPQLEKVLNLAPDSLTKEIKLTQDLMQLFIKYQIPSDLLSFDASAAATSSEDGAELLGGPTPGERLAAVKAHVAAMQEMIEKAKQEELHERRMEVGFARPELMMKQEETSSSSGERSSKRRRTLELANPPPDGLGHALCAKIRESAYYRNLDKRASFDELLAQGEKQLDSVDVYSDGKPSPLFCCLYRFFEFKLTGRQLQRLINHRESPFWRCCGFLYVRIALPPANVASLAADYTRDDHHFLPVPTAKKSITMGEYVEGLLTEETYYGLPLPRLPVLVKQRIRADLVTLQRDRQRLPARRAQGLDWKPKQLDWLADGPPKQPPPEGYGFALLKKMGWEENQSKGEQPRSRGEDDRIDWSRHKGRSDQELVDELRRVRRYSSVVASGKDYARKPLGYKAACALPREAGPGSVNLQQRDRERDRDRDEDRGSGTADAHKFMPVKQELIALKQECNLDCGSSHARSYVPPTSRKMVQREAVAHSCPAPPPPPPAAAAASASPAPGPAASQRPAQPQPQQPQPPEGGTSGGSAGPVLDYTKVPKELDKKFEAMDTDSSLRPTIINVSDTWEKRAQKALLAKPETSILGADEQKTEKDAAFDLLDGLTKSGALSVSHAALHVVIAATHCFDKTVIETVVKDNLNPIDKVERSTLIMATTVHRRPAAALIQQSQQARVQGTSPMLFLEDQA